jgi:large subunit ribosomal protein L35
MVRQGQEGVDMPKMKTNRGAAKRFKATANGKVVRSKAYAGHKFTSKNAKRKRNLRKSGLIHKSNESAVKKLLPYL